MVDSASYATALQKRVSVASTQTQFSKVFDFDDVLMKHKIYQKSFRSMLRRAATPTSMPETTPLQDRSLSETALLEVKPAQNRSLSDTTLLRAKSGSLKATRFDSIMRREPWRASREVEVLALGSKYSRSAIIKHMRVQHGEVYHSDDIEKYRRKIVALLISAIVTVLDYNESNGSGLVSQQSRDHSKVVREYAITGGQTWQITDEIATSVKSLWENWHVKQALTGMNHDCATAQ